MLLLCPKCNKNTAEIINLWQKYNPITDTLLKPTKQQRFESFEYEISVCQCCMSDNYVLFKRH